MLRSTHAKAAAAASLLLILTIALAGCSDDATGPDDPPLVEADLIKSDLPRDTSPDVPGADLEQLAAGNHQFAVALYQELRAERNLLISPLSIRAAFAMVHAGALGETAAEMDEALRYGLAQASLHPAWNGRDLILRGRSRPGDDETTPLELHTVNSVWCRPGYPFVTDYLDLLAVHYGTGVRELDLIGQPEASRRAINAWVAGETRQRILDLLPPGALQGSPAVVLVNALYFNAAWKNPFDPDLTANGTFHNLDGSATDQPMLRQRKAFGYYEEPGCQVLEMPFSDDDESLAMVVVLPAEGGFASFTAGLDVATLDRLLDGPTGSDVEVTLPRFSFEYTCELKEPLQRLGMQRPFTPAADFGGMTQNDELWIAEAYHKTFIAVTEEGVEAAAAAGVVMVDSAPPDHHTFLADRPFLVLIHDRETGTILFLGQVVAP
jgi:serpin B